MMIPMNPIVAMLHNANTGRFHPILFDESPLPGPHSPDKPIRHKSQGHHTKGYDTLELAIEGAKGPEMGARMKEVFGIEPRYALDEVITWHGEDLPTMMAFFVEVEGKLKRAL